MASPALSQASTAFENDAPQTHDDQKGFKRATLQRAKEAATSQDILLFLVAFRILNALSIRTFFQPDEYYQSLEPAWDIAFGPNSGAWITWVCDNFLKQWIWTDCHCRSGRTNYALRYIQPSSLQSTGCLLSCPCFCDSVRICATSSCLLRRKLHRQ